MEVVKATITCMGNAKHQRKSSNIETDIIIYCFFWELGSMSSGLASNMKCRDISINLCGIIMNTLYSMRTDTQNVKCEALTKKSTDRNGYNNAARFVIAYTNLQQQHNDTQ